MNGRLKCYTKCEHDHCKGKEHNAIDYEFCQFCQNLCAMCERIRFHATVRSFVQ